MGQSHGTALCRAVPYPATAARRLRPAWRVPSGLRHSWVLTRDTPPSRHAPAGSGLTGMCRAPVPLLAPRVVPGAAADPETPGLLPAWGSRAMPVPVPAGPSTLSAAAQPGWPPRSAHGRCGPEGIPAERPGGGLRPWPGAGPGVGPGAGRAGPGKGRGLSESPAAARLSSRRGRTPSGVVGAGARTLPGRRDAFRALLLLLLRARRQVAHACRDPSVG